MLTITEKVTHTNISGRRCLRWIGKCTCGNEILLFPKDIKSRKTESCGCVKPSDLTGERFGFLVVVETLPPRYYERAGKKTLTKGMVLCRCDCGAEKEVLVDSLKAGVSTSCGSCSRLGPLSANYDHTKTEEERSHTRKYTEYYQWRKEVYKADNYTCFVCGNAKSGNIVAHHIQSYTMFEEYRTLAANGVTLCKACHKEYHHLFGMVGACAYDFENYLTIKRNQVNADRPI